MKYAVVSYRVGEAGDTEVHLFNSNEEAKMELQKLWLDSFNSASHDDNFDENNTYCHDDFAVVAWKDSLYKYFDVVGVDVDKIIAAETIYDQLKMFMIQNNWLDDNIPEQSRALFTTLCFVAGIDADTSNCDNILSELYNAADMESADVSYDEFDIYMCELIV